MSKQFIEKLQEEKHALQQKHVSLQTNVGKVMLMNQDKSAQDEVAATERHQFAQRMIAEAQNRKKDTSMLGAQI